MQGVKRFVRAPLRGLWNMRITFLLAGGFDLSGGNRVIAIYAERLMRRGHHVLVIARPTKPFTLRDRVRALRRGRWLPIRQKPHPSHFDGKSIPRRTIDTHRPIIAADAPDADVTIATWWETGEWLATFPPEKGAKAFFVQGYEAFPHIPKDRVDAVWRMPFHKIIISRWLADLSADRFGDHDYSLVRNSVDTDQFAAPPRGRQPIPTIGFLQSDLPLKGNATSVAALRTLMRRHPRIRLLTFGEGQLRETLPAGVDHRHWQRPPQDFLRNIYAQCDVWLCGSSTEGFHLPPLEAMACRCPVVSTEVGGPLDIVRDGENGFLAPVNDSVALGNKLIELFDQSQSDWQRMSDNAYATAIGYTWEDATDQFEAGLLRAVERSTTGSIR